MKNLHNKIYRNFMYRYKQIIPSELICEFCNREKINGTYHIIPHLNNKPLRRNIRNLIGLCLNCFNKFQANQISKEQLLLITKNRDFDYKNQQ